MCAADSALGRILGGCRPGPTTAPIPADYGVLSPDVEDGWPVAILYAWSVGYSTSKISFANVTKQAAGHRDRARVDGIGSGTDVPLGRTAAHSLEPNGQRKTQALDGQLPSRTLIGRGLRCGQCDRRVATRLQGERHILSRPEVEGVLRSKVWSSFPRERPQTLATARDGRKASGALSSRWRHPHYREKSGVMGQPSCTRAGGRSRARPGPPQSSGRRSPCSAASKSGVRRPWT